MESETPDPGTRSLRRMKAAWFFISGGLAVIAGILLALCYPPFNQATLVWVALVPLLMALWFAPPGNPWRRGRRGFGLGLLTSLTFFSINLSWIREVSPPGWVILSLYLALYPAAWGVFAATVGRPRDETLAPVKERRDYWTRHMRAAVHALRLAFLNAALWCGAEWMRGSVFTGFGWNGLGVAFHDNPVLIQAAEYVGVTGLSFAPMFFACVAATTLRRFQLEIRAGSTRTHIDFAAAVLLVVAMFGHGLSALRRPLGRSIEVRSLLVQGGVPQALKNDPAHARRILDEYHDLTAPRLEAEKFDLVIWPESSLPTPLIDYQDAEAEKLYAAYLNDLLRRGEFSFLLGADDFSPAGAYNSAFLLCGRFDDTSMQTHAKVHLVPFGEFLPYRKQLPWLSAWLVNQIPGDFDRGSSMEPMRLSRPNVDVIPLICFEDTVGSLARKFVRQRPQVIVNLTNDGWFNRSPASHQHLANAKFRAVELRRPLVRVCNTGVTCVIDPFGRVVTKLQDPENGTFGQGSVSDTVEVPQTPPTTFYALRGDVFTGAVCLLCLPSLGMAWWRGRGRRTARERV